MSLLKRSILNEKKSINQQDKTLNKINKILTKLYNHDNTKIDTIRLLYLYLNGNGRDINLEYLIKKLKE